ncbi:trimethylamine methyltransferase family protein, partial [bacterium]|nr:trimethylamine methyltransferase family protein [bacterium]
KLIDKNPFSVWQKRGGKSMEERASKMVDDILAKHKTEPLPEEIQKAIHEVVLREQAWINSK